MIHSYHQPLYYLFNCYYLTAFFFLEISITTTPAEIIIANANGTACIVSPVCAAGAFSDESVPVDGTFASSLLSGVEGVGLTSSLPAVSLGITVTLVFSVQPACKQCCDLEPSSVVVASLSTVNSLANSCPRASISLVSSCPHTVHIPCFSPFLYMLLP